MLIDCFKVVGCFKPYVRMTQRSMHVDAQAQQYLVDKTAMGMQFKQQMNGRQMIARRKPIIVSIYIFHDHGFHNRDLDNETKAILDAAQGIVFEDDRWIDEIQAYRRRGDECRVGLWVKVL